MTDDPVLTVVVSCLMVASALFGWWILKRGAGRDE
jgi:hypothetical protein